MKQIPILVEGAINIPLSKLRPIQGELKELSNEDFVLLRSKILSGVRFVFHVWKESPENDWWYIIDGHGRDKILHHLVQNEQYQEPRVPCAIVKASTLEQAKKLVLDSSSTFHRMRPDGLKEFMDSLDLKPVDLKQYRLIEIDLPKFEAAYFPEDKKPKGSGDGATELDRNSFTVFKQQCPKCGFSFDDNKAGDE